MDVSTISTARDDLGGGQGIAGMRRRLESVGGALDIVQTDDPDRPRFTAVASVPVRSPSPRSPGAPE
ncbi:hypothetical protein BL253_06755 [Pseudofrankia asymbiotica]|uniref:Sensor histidine kinase NatK C-terminal domain-containing protein n=1 Tax=Pseudofrankia asymbiotica TaxID=1834516 RepID=A0A1V2IFT6_9ACTN|nr:hypothetical protein BL253_06755 [Pseudofrankia asymbiotica]